MGVFSTAIVAAIVAFIVSMLYSTADGHLGLNALTIESDHSTVQREDFYSELAQFARNNDFEVAITYSSLAVSDGEYRVYSSSRAPDAGRWERPRFERGKVDIIYPLEGFPQPDPRQNVFIKGSAVNKQDLVQWLNGQGLGTVPMTNNLIKIFTSSSLPILLTLSILLCLILGAGHVLARSREIGIHRLLGLSVFATIRNEIQRQRKTLVGTFIGAPLILAGLLYIYNGWALAEVFWAVFFLLSVVLSVCLFVGYLGGQFLVRMTSIPQSIKGKVHARPVLYSLSIVRCVTLVAALGAVAGLVGFTAELGERQRLQEVWDAHPEPHEFALNTNTAFEEYTDSSTTEPFREADKAGELFLIDPYWITWPTELEAPVLLVNQEFAKQSGVSELNGTSVTVCSPLELSQESVKTIEDSIEFEASYANEAAPTIEWRSDCNLGTVFTYDVNFRPQVNDPILVILPLGLAPLGNHNLISKVSQQTLISSSTEIPVQLQQDATGNTLSYSRPREDSWLESIRTTKHNVILWGLNTFAAILLVTVLVGATIISFRVAYRRKIHIAYICGRSPWWVSRQVLIIEVAFFLVAIAWLTYKIREHLIQADSHIPSTWNIGFENQWSPITIAAVIGFSGAWLLASILLALKAASRWDARQGAEPQ